MYVQNTFNLKLKETNKWKKCLAKEFWNKYNMLRKHHIEYHTLLGLKRNTMLCCYYIRKQDSYRVDVQTNEVLL